MTNEVDGEHIPSPVTDTAVDEEKEYISAAEKTVPCEPVMKNDSEAINVQELQTGYLDSRQSVIVHEVDKFRIETVETIDKTSVILQEEEKETEEPLQTEIGETTIDVQVKQIEQKIPEPEQPTEGTLSPDDLKMYKEASEKQMPVTQETIEEESVSLVKETEQLQRQVLAEETVSTKVEEMQKEDVTSAETREEPELPPEQQKLVTVGETEVVQVTVAKEVQMTAFEQEHFAEEIPRADVDEKIEEAMEESLVMTTEDKTFQADKTVAMTAAETEDVRDDAVVTETETEPVVEIQELVEQHKRVVTEAVEFATVEPVHCETLTEELELVTSREKALLREQEEVEIEQIASVSDTLVLPATEKEEEKPYHVETREFVEETPLTETPDELSKPQEAVEERPQQVGYKTEDTYVSESKVVTEIVREEVEPDELQAEEVEDQVQCETAEEPQHIREDEMVTVVPRAAIDEKTEEVTQAAEEVVITKAEHEAFHTDKKDSEEEMVTEVIHVTKTTETEKQVRVVPVKDDVESYKPVSEESIEEELPSEESTQLELEQLGEAAKEPLAEEVLPSETAVTEYAPVMEKEDAKLLEFEPEMTTEDVTSAKTREEPEEVIKTPLAERPPEEQKAITVGETEVVQVSITKEVEMSAFEHEHVAEEVPRADVDEKIEEIVETAEEGVVTKTEDEAFHADKIMAVTAAETEDIGDDVVVTETETEPVAEIEELTEQQKAEREAMEEEEDEQEEQEEQEEAVHRETVTDELVTIEETLVLPVQKQAEIEQMAAANDTDISLASEREQDKPYQVERREFIEGTPLTETAHELSEPGEAVSKRPQEVEYITEDTPVAQTHFAREEAKPDELQVEEKVEEEAPYENAEQPLHISEEEMVTEVIHVTRTIETEKQIRVVPVKDEVESYKPVSEENVEELLSEESTQFEVEQLSEVAEEPLAEEVLPSETAVTEYAPVMEKEDVKLLEFEPGVATEDITSAEIREEPEEVIKTSLAERPPEEQKPITVGETEVVQVSITKEVEMPAFEHERVAEEVPREGVDEKTEVVEAAEEGMVTKTEDDAFHADKKDSEEEMVTDVMHVTKTVETEKQVRVVPVKDDVESYEPESEEGVEELHSEGSAHLELEQLSETAEGPLVEEVLPSETSVTQHAPVMEMEDVKLLEFEPGVTAEDVTPAKTREEPELSPEEHKVITVAVTEVVQVDLAKEVEVSVADSKSVTEFATEAVKPYRPQTEEKAEEEASYETAEEPLHISEEEMVTEVIHVARTIETEKQVRVVPVKHDVESYKPVSEEGAKELRSAESAQLQLEQLGEAAEEPLAEEVLPCETAVTQHAPAMEKEDVKLLEFEPEVTTVDVASAEAREGETEVVQVSITKEVEMSAFEHEQVAEEVPRANVDEKLEEIAETAEERVVTKTEDEAFHADKVVAMTAAETEDIGDDAVVTETETEPVAKIEELTEQQKEEAEALEDEEKEEEILQEQEQEQEEAVHSETVTDELITIQETAALSIHRQAKIEQVAAVSDTEVSPATERQHDKAYQLERREFIEETPLTETADELSKPEEAVEETPQEVDYITEGMRVTETKVVTEIANEEVKPDEFEDEAPCETAEEPLHISEDKMVTKVMHTTRIIETQQAVRLVTVKDEVESYKPVREEGVEELRSEGSAQLELEQLSEAAEEPLAEEVLPSETTETEHAPVMEKEDVQLLEFEPEVTTEDMTSAETREEPERSPEEQELVTVGETEVVQVDVAKEVEMSAYEDEHVAQKVPRADVDENIEEVMEAVEEGVAIKTDDEAFHAQKKDSEEEIVTEVMHITRTIETEKQVRVIPVKDDVESYKPVSEEDVEELRSAESAQLELEQLSKAAEEPLADEVLPCETAGTEHAPLIEKDDLKLLEVEPEVTTEDVTSSETREEPELSDEEHKLIAVAETEIVQVDVAKEVETSVAESESVTEFVSEVVKLHRPQTEEKVEEEVPYETADEPLHISDEEMVTQFMHTERTIETQKKVRVVTVKDDVESYKPMSEEAAEVAAVKPIETADEQLAASRDGIVIEELEVEESTAVVLATKEKEEEPPKEEGDFDAIQLIETRREEYEHVVGFTPEEVQETTAIVKTNFVAEEEVESHQLGVEETVDSIPLVTTRDDFVKSNNIVEQPVLISQQEVQERELIQVQETKGTAVTETEEDAKEIEPHDTRNAFEEVRPEMEEEDILIAETDSTLEAVSAQEEDHGMVTSSAVKEAEPDEVADVQAELLESEQTAAATTMTADEAETDDAENVEERKIEMVETEVQDIESADDQVAVADEETVASPSREMQNIQMTEPVKAQDSESTLEAEVELVHSAAEKIHTYKLHDEDDEIWTHSTVAHKITTRKIRIEEQEEVTDAFSEDVEPLVLQLPEAESSVSEEVHDDSMKAVAGDQISDEELESDFELLLEEQRIKYDISRSEAHDPLLELLPEDTHEEDSDLMEPISAVSGEETGLLEAKGSADDAPVEKDIKSVHDERTLPAEGEIPSDFKTDVVTVEMAEVTERETPTKTITEGVGGDLRAVSSYMVEEMVQKVLHQTLVDDTGVVYPQTLPSETETCTDTELAETKELTETAGEESVSREHESLIEMEKEEKFDVEVGTLAADELDTSEEMVENDYTSDASIVQMHTEEAQLLPTEAEPGSDEPDVTAFESDKVTQPSDKVESSDAGLLEAAPSDVSTIHTYDTVLSDETPEGVNIPDVELTRRESEDKAGDSLDVADVVGMTAASSTDDKSDVIQEVAADLVSTAIKTAGELESSEKLSCQDVEPQKGREVSVPQTLVAEGGQSTVVHVVRSIRPDGEIVEQVVTVDSASALEALGALPSPQTSLCGESGEEMEPASSSSAVVVYTETVEERPDSETEMTEYEEFLPDGTLVRRKVVKTTRHEAVTRRVVVDETPAESSVDSEAPVTFVRYSDRAEEGPVTVSVSDETVRGTLPDGRSVVTHSTVTSEQKLVMQRTFVAVDDRTGDADLKIMDNLLSSSQASGNYGRRME